MEAKTDTIIEARTIREGFNRLRNGELYPFSIESYTCPSCNTEKMSVIVDEVVIFGGVATLLENGTRTDSCPECCPLVF